MNIVELKRPGGLLIYNASLISRPESQLFDVSTHQSETPGEAKGRGNIQCFVIDDREVVLKQYLRGGLVGKIIQASYFFTGYKRTRMAAEFYLLAYMADRGLPVPLPVAANINKRGVSYTGSLATERIKDAITLSEHLQESPLEPGLWSKIGRIIQRFHQERIFHSDLNANNVMLNRESQIFLIDFDKCSVKGGHQAEWQQRNLARLKRSLSKLKAYYDDFHFEESDWQELLEGYQEGFSARASSE